MQPSLPNFSSRLTLRPIPLALSLAALAVCASAQQSSKPKPPVAITPAPATKAVQSTHYPILLLAAGNEPFWSVRIGPKGPERLERAGYPPITLEPSDISRDGTAETWTYHAKDTGTSAAVAVHLSRESCSDGMSPTKFTFRATVDHAQIGTLKGCARIAAELFPRAVGQTAEDDGSDPDAKKPPAIPPITKFKVPTAVAYVNPAGKIVVTHGELKKIAAPSGSELCLSHDGKKLLYTRSDSKTGPDRTIMLWDSAAIQPKELIRGLVRQAFWSPDDNRIAFLKSQQDHWQVFIAPANSSLDSASPAAPNSVTALHGWIDAHTVLASDAQNAYWISDDKPLQTVPLREIYGDAFQIMSSDSLRVNPANADLLLVSADFASAPATAPTDSMNLAAGFFLYELRSKRRVVLNPADQWARNAEWSRDGIQIFYARRVSSTAFTTNRVFWDGSGLRRFQDGYDLVVGE